jgi:hypothetical protein
MTSYPRNEGVEQGTVGMSSGIVRLSGWAGVLAAVMYVLAGILVLATPSQGIFDSFSDYLSGIILVVAFAVTLVVIVGLHGSQRGSYGRIGAAGALITFIGYALIVVVAGVGLLVEGEALFTVRLIAALAVLIGSVLLGAMTLRARVLPWWCGVLLIVGFPLGDIFDEIISRGSEGIVFGIVWGLVGYALLSSNSAPNRRSVRVN